MDTPKKGPAGAPGQQKVHTISNPTTGETRQITQEEWREQGKALRDQGFNRPEDLDETQPDVPETGEAGAGEGAAGA